MLVDLDMDVLTVEIEMGGLSSLVHLVLKRCSNRHFEHPASILRRAIAFDFENLAYVKFVVNSEAFRRSDPIFDIYCCSL